MPKGGGFSGGGGFKGGGFSSGGGFKGGGFSGGGRPNGTNFSSYRPNSGARPPSSQNSNMHSSGSSFLWGALVGSILNQNTSQNTNNSHPVYDDSYMKDAPLKPTPEPEYREFKYCEYCKSEFSDLTVNKCPNCGAKLVHKKVMVNQPITPNASGYQTQYNATPQPVKKKNKAWIIPVIILVIAAIVIFSSTGGSGKVISDAVVTWSQPASPALTRYYTTADLITAEYLQFQVTGVQLADGINELDLSTESGVKYVIVQTKIINTNSYDIPIYIRDFSIKYNGKNYQPLQIDYSWYFNFDNGSGLSKYFVLGTYEVMEGTFVYKIENYVEGDIKFEYIEYEYDQSTDTNYLIGIYQIDIN